MASVLHREMRAALKATVGKRGMSEEEVMALTDYVLSFFGHESEVIDNRLDVDDRDVFYMLEEEGLLGTRQEEIHIRRGKLWRIHYWILRTERIKQLAAADGGPGRDDSSAVYREVPEEAWSRPPAGL
jgi:hypothetical protein